METKKYYKKPEVHKVKLVPEEAVLGGCKTNTGNIGNPPTNWKCGGPCNKDQGT